MSMSIAELRAEIAAKEKHVSKLRAERQKVARQLAALDRDLAAVGGRAAKAKPKAAKKAKRKIAAKKKPAKRRPSLADVLAQALAGKGNVKVAEAGKLALAAGYRSTSSQFGNIVSQALTADKRFKKVSRGVYALKGAGETAAKTSPGKVAKKVAKKDVKKAVKRTVKKVAKRAAKRAGRGGKKPLAQYLAEALGKARTGMRAMNLADAVLKAGYSTKDKNFKQTVAGTLSTNNRFERVSRGVYKLA